MSCREFICIEDPCREFGTCYDKAFLLHIQKAILLSLEEKKLISKQERAQCEEALENR